MEKILLLALYVVEVAKCLLLYRACADMRPKNYVGIVAGGAFYALVLGDRQEIGLPFGIAIMHLIVFAAMAHGCSGISSKNTVVLAGIDLRGDLP